ncbi:MAG: aminoacyl-tRNA hydrolase [Thermoanaerobaculia bacterium]
MVGLGNPGADYRATRHNLGFLAVERLAERLGLGGPVREECRALLVGDGERLVCQPQTYMNRSGAAVRCLAERYELGPERILVIYDEVHLALGRLRLRAGGSPAGHRGMESIVDALQTEAVPRLRLGIGPPPSAMALDQFVLQPFLAEELEAVEDLVGRAALAAEAWMVEGIERAMTRSNAPDLPEAPPTA